MTEILLFLAVIFLALIWYGQAKFWSSTENQLKYVIGSLDRIDQQVEDLANRARENFPTDEERER